MIQPVCIKNARALGRWLLWQGTSTLMILPTGTARVTILGSRFSPHIEPRDLGVIACMGGSETSDENCSPQVVVETQMATPREHIEQIRRCKFSIGREDNPLTEDLYHAVKHLSAELYTKDIHFLMELIQNAQDNEYPSNVDPSLEFVVTSRDVTGVGASATLLVFNNEKGFTSQNVESLCSVGRSTKKGKREGGYIGEKGIGFKSVFLVTSYPHIFSNGYRIRFDESPSKETKIGYIVPQWVDDKPTVEDLLNVYCGHPQGELPTTVIILPLREEKVEAVKEQLTNLHPEVILFMSKIKRLSFRDDSQKNVNTISVSKEIEFRTEKDQQCESFTLDLLAQENNVSTGECSYYMWRHTFPVQADKRVEGREEVEKWILTLAFPVQQRVTMRNGVGVGAGIYSFLPTEMVTGLPFIIQADFLLSSSRESIRWDNKWNQGILDCVPSAFCAAFLSLVKSQDSAPPSSRSYCFDKYLPLNEPSYPELRSVRDTIQAKLKAEEIIFCEGHKTYCTPSQARTILPAFRDIVQEAMKQGLEKPRALWDTGIFVVHPCMDDLRSLEFLGVQQVSYDWYSQCINLCGHYWVAKLSEDLYVQLLCFVARYWNQGIYPGLNQFPLFKYLTSGYRRSVGWASFSEISSAKGLKIYYSSEEKDIAWLTRWGAALGDAAQYRFMPNATQIAMNKLSHSDRSTLQEWLRCYPKITDLTVSNFSKQILDRVNMHTSKAFIICVAHFFHFSHANDYIYKREMVASCSELPVVDNFGSVIRSCTAKLVPTSIGNWVKLMGNNPWAAQGVVALSSEYMNPPDCAAGLKGSGQDYLKLFISDGLNAVDIPYLRPPNAALPGFFSSVGQETVLLLLDWINHLTVTREESLPTEFKRSIMEGKWVNTHKGYQSPNMCFLWDNKWSSAGLQLNDLSFINTSFYKKSMAGFETALRQLGVVVEVGEGCEVVAKHLQMHTDFAAIIRLYKYLHLCKWMPSDKNSVKIWIPQACRSGGEWKDAKTCVVHDDNGLFFDRLNILENVYEAALLPYFSSYLRVPLHPTTENYCKLWLQWGASQHSVTEAECCLVWRVILKHQIQSKVYLEKKEPKLPTYTGSGCIQLAAANETFVPDDLSMKEVFQKASKMVKFAWYPNPSHPEIAVDLLFSMYGSLGARRISQAVQKNEVSVSGDISLRKLEAGEGLLLRGLYKIVLGYLACPLFRLSVDKRQQIATALIESSVYDSSKPFNVEFTLTLVTENASPHSITRTRDSCVRWQKDKQRILMHRPNPLYQKAKASFATEFAQVVSNGLLPEHPDLVAGFSEMIKVACICDFDDDVVNDMLRDKNLQLFKEDESLLLKYFPDTTEEFVPLTPPREQIGTNWSGRQRFETPPRPLKSPHLLDGWEKRLQIFEQAVEKMKDSMPSSLKTKLVTLLFPSTSDDGEPESTPGFHHMKVVGDAYLKMLTVAEVLRANDTKQVTPYNLDKLLGREMLEAGRCFVRGGLTDQPSSADPVEECDIEILKAIAGAAALRFYGPQV